MQEPPPRALGEQGPASDSLEARPASVPLAFGKLGPETLTPILLDALHARLIPLAPLIVPVRDAALRLVVAERLLAPTIAYAVHAVAVIGDRALELTDGTLLPTSERLAGAERLAAAVCGIGRGIDRRAAAALAAGDGRLALALDLIGTHAVFRLSDHVRRLVRKSARENGFAIGGPLEPGMANFPLRDQAVLVRLADAKPMGFCVTSSGAVGPGRVLTFAIPIGRDLSPWRPADRCLHCPSREACQRMGMAADD
ncbi:MAG: hypothetical protein ABSC37_09750 [Xanthobacteraceae bacterium]